jgi:hypothetical protein
LAELARFASTALAIRLLAHRKNYTMPPPRLPFTSETLRERAQHVKTIERKHNLRVVEQICDTMKTTTEILRSSVLDKMTRVSLQAVMRDLQSNAKHLATSGSFSSLPVPIEYVEMEDDQVEETSIELAADKPPAPPIEMKSEPVAPPPIPKRPPAKPASASVARAARVVPIHLRTQPIAINSPSLWRHFSVWLKTPMGVTWREAGEIARRQTE